MRPPQNQYSEGNRSMNGCNAQNMAVVSQLNTNDTTIWQGGGGGVLATLTHN